MFERLRFVRYALRFERAFKTDEWTAVAECFRADARYIVAGSATEWDGETRGRDAIVAFFKKMLDAVDRKFDSRKPGLAGLPRVKRGVLTLPWKARYTVRGASMVLHGVSECRFDGGMIAELKDTMQADECARWAAMIGVDAGATRP